MWLDLDQDLADEFTQSTSETPLWRARLAQAGYTFKRPPHGQRKSPMQAAVDQRRWYAKLKADPGRYTLFLAHIRLRRRAKPVSVVCRGPGCCNFIVQRADVGGRVKEFCRPACRERAKYYARKTR